MGELVLHPNHPLYKQCPHPKCPECGCEIVPMTPVNIEQLDDGRLMFRHAECASKLEAE